METEMAPINFSKIPPPPSSHTRFKVSNWFTRTHTLILIAARRFNEARNQVYLLITHTKTNAGGDVMEI